ncbi:MAG: metal-sensitive transcriptional regulator [Methylocystaceae bacterium]
MDNIIEGSKAKHDIQARLKRIEGQIRGLQRMVEAEESCADVMNQVAAVKAAIGQVGVLIFQTHSRQCLLDAVDAGAEETDHAVDDIVKILSRIFK